MQNEDQEVGDEPRLGVHTNFNTRVTEREGLVLTQNKMSWE